MLASCCRTQHMLGCVFQQLVDAKAERKWSLMFSEKSPDSGTQHFATDYGHKTYSPIYVFVHALDGGCGTWVRVSLWTNEMNWMYRMHGLWSVPDKCWTEILLATLQFGDQDIIQPRSKLITCFDPSREPWRLVKDVLRVARHRVILVRFLSISQWLQIIANTLFSTQKLLSLEEIYICKRRDKAKTFFATVFADLHVFVTRDFLFARHCWINQHLTIQPKQIHACGCSHHLIIVSVMLCNVHSITVSKALLASVSWVFFPLFHFSVSSGSWAKAVERTLTNHEGRCGLTILAFHTCPLAL